MLTDALRAYFLYRTNLSDGLVTAEAALRAAVREGDLAGQAAAHLSIAGISTLRSRHAEVVEHHEIAISLSRRAQWTAGVAIGENNLSIIYTQSGDEQRALAHLDAALAA